MIYLTFFSLCSSADVKPTIFLSRCTSLCLILSLNLKTLRWHKAGPTNTDCTNKKLSRASALPEGFTFYFIKPLKPRLAAHAFETQKQRQRVHGDLQLSRWSVLCLSGSNTAYTRSFCGMKCGCGFKCDGNNCYISRLLCHNQSD